MMTKRSDYNSLLRSSEQCFNLNNKVIAIDWGKNGDAAVYVEAKKNSDGTLTVTEVREIHKN